jgi:hypothetical protein
VRKAVHALGYIPSVIFDDPYITATIRNLWQTWELFEATLECKGEHFIRKDFERVYAAIFGRPISQSQLLPLMGAGERSYIESGSRWAGTPREQKPHIEQVVTGLPSVVGIPQAAAKQVRKISGEVARLAGKIGTLPE